MKEAKQPISGVTPSPVTENLVVTSDTLHHPDGRKFTGELFWRVENRTTGTVDWVGCLDCSQEVRKAAVKYDDQERELEKEKKKAEAKKRWMERKLEAETLKVEGPSVEEKLAREKKKTETVEWLQSQMEELEIRSDRLSFHVEKLEMCVRMVNNDSLEWDSVMKILKEPLKTYVEAIPDELDTIDPEDCYDELGLDSMDDEENSARDE